MQQRSAKPGSNHTPLVRVMSWISSIGMLSSGMVWAQGQTVPDAAIDKTAYETPVSLEIAPVEPAPVALETAPSIEVPETIPQWVQPAPAAPEPVPVEAMAPEPAPLAADPVPPPAAPEPAPLAVEIEPPPVPVEAQTPTASELLMPKEQPQVATEPIPLPNSIALPETSPASAPTKTQAPIDYSNVYIDPTSYSLGATKTYEEPNSVVLSERSTGCEAVLGKGQGVSGNLCDNATQAQSPPTTDSLILPPPPPPVADLPAAINGGTLPSLEAQPYVPPQPVQPYAQTVPVPEYIQPVATQPYAPSQPAQRYAQPVPAQRYAQPVPAQRYAEIEQAPVEELQPVSVGVFEVTSSGVSVGNVAPPSAGGYYYNPSSPRLLGLPGNGNTSLLFPLSMPAPITSAFGWRIHPISGGSSFHAGTDIGAPMGAPVLAALTGKVEIADYLGGYGLAVILKHNQGTEETLYGHLSQILVKPGDVVEQGSVIGQVGSTGNSTGPHLHFEFRQLTAKGWETLDPGAQLEYALARLVKAVETAQSAPKPTAQVAPKPTAPSAPQPGAS
ncbi:M23 family metallopeptidase [Microcoleus sp. FACHB-672]|uniref:M23 family metallopeptidase n=1 Tax=Microcoleus sp. FACHB-672 TaxID=2692825 RepID=UPI001F5572BA|nr:M23 family metallopeptidase [Microcoleus sp. FACHB-672]